MSGGRRSFCALAGVMIALAGATGCESELRGALNDLIDEGEAAAAKRAVVYRGEIEKLEAELETFAGPDESADDADRCPARPAWTSLLAPEEQWQAHEAAVAAYNACRTLLNLLNTARENLEAVSADRFARDREELAALAEAELVAMAPLMRDEARRSLAIDAEAVAAQRWERYLRARGEDGGQ